MLLIMTAVGAVFAQDAQSVENELPQLRSGFPDPAAVIGSVGSLYQDNYPYYDTVYTTYLYPRPESSQTFIEVYTALAGNAGYSVVGEEVSGFSILRISTTETPDISAMLFYDYQGYMLLMVPEGMSFTLSSGEPEPAEPSALVTRGYEAIQNEDYEAAVRYLISAAGTYIRTKAMTMDDLTGNTDETNTEPGGPTTYTVQDGDNCWSIAVDKFGVNFELFMQVNGMVSCDIRIGDEVIIPGADQELATATPIPLDQYAVGEIVSYTVVMNDSYNDIASKFNTTLDSIQRLNNVNAYTGFPVYGQVLQIEVNLNTPTPLPEPTATPDVATLQP